MCYPIYVFLSFLHFDCDIFFFFGKVQNMQNYDINVTAHYCILLIIQHCKRLHFYEMEGQNCEVHFVFVRGLLTIGKTLRLNVY